MKEALRGGERGGIKPLNIVAGFTFQSFQVTKAMIMTLRFYSILGAKVHQGLSFNLCGSANRFFRRLMIS